MTPEGAIKRVILDYLAARHILAFRMNTMTSIRSYKGKQRRIDSGVPGMADVLAFPQIKVHCPAGCSRPLIAPFPVWLEVKAEKGKQSELQKSFQAQVEAEGHLYRIVRSVQDVEEALR